MVNYVRFCKHCKELFECKQSKVRICPNCFRRILSEKELTKRYYEEGLNIIKNNGKCTQELE